LTARQTNDATQSDRLEWLRHSAAHIMAEAVSLLFPPVQLGIGPPIDGGFYYDFGLSRPLTPEDLSAIEAKMSEIIASNAPFKSSPRTPPSSAKRPARSRHARYSALNRSSSS